MPGISFELVPNVESLELTLPKPPEELLENQKAIRDQLQEEWASLKSADVVIRCCDGSDVLCHKIILGALSDLLKRALRASNVHEVESPVIIAPEVDAEVLKAFLSKVYRGGSDEVKIDASLGHLGFAEENEFSPLSTDKRIVCKTADGERVTMMKTNKKKKKKKKSAVWNYFEKIDSDQCRCQFCLRVVHIRQSSTSNMIRHLQNHHQPAFQEYVQLSELARVESQVKEDNPESGDIEFDGKGIEAELKVAPFYDGAPISSEDKTLSSDYQPKLDVDIDLFPVGPKQSCITTARKKKKTGRKVADKKAAIWNCYSVEDKNKAKCKECGVKVRAEAGSVSGLTRHLKHAHPEVLKSLNKAQVDSKDTLDMEAEDLPVKLEEKEEDEEPEELAPTKVSDVKFMEPVPVIPNPIWNYFFVQSDKATCQTCQTELTTNKDGSPSVLVGHLKTHPESFQKYIQEVNAISLDPNRNVGKRVKKSAIWNFFHKIDKENTQCMTCDKQMTSKQQTTTNMIRHLQNKHKETFLDFMELSGHDRASVKLKRLKETPKKKRGPKRSYDQSDMSHRTCPECLKVYSCRPAMLYHKKVVHSGVRPFKCEECGMTFARVDSYRLHSHNSERTFLCSVCGKTFARKNIRDVHERAHHGDRRHPCSFCDKKFMTNQQKSNHERVHTGERPYQCTDCGRQFAQQHQLTTHTRIHTGLKPYNCDYCSQMFRHLSSRNNHKCEGKTAAKLTSSLEAKNPGDEDTDE